MDANMEKSLKVMAEKVVEYIRENIYLVGSDGVGFVVEEGNLCAYIRYSAEYRYHKGDRWTPSDWSLESENITVEEVEVDGETDKEAAELLQNIIDNMAI